MHIFYRAVVCAWVGIIVSCYGHPSIYGKYAIQSKSDAALDKFWVQSGMKIMIRSKMNKKRRVKSTFILNEGLEGCFPEKCVSFESFFSPEHVLVLGPDGSIVVEKKRDGTSFRKRASFVLQDALNQSKGTPDQHTVSFESLAHRGYFLVAENGSLKWRKRNGTESFDDSATFFIHRPLIDF